jgi:archaellum biogenesis ATPase FlaH
MKPDDANAEIYFAPSEFGDISGQQASQTIPFEMQKGLTKFHSVQDALTFTEAHARAQDGAIEIEPKMIKQGKVTQTVGAPGIGKSFLSHLICLRHAEEGGNVLYVQADQGQELTARQREQVEERGVTDRYRILQTDLTDEGCSEWLKSVRSLNRLFATANDDPDLKAALREKCSIAGGLVVIDHIGQFVNLFDHRAVLSFQSDMQAFASNTQVAIWELNHPNKTFGDPDQPMVFAGVNDVQKGLDQLNYLSGSWQGQKLTLSVRAGKSRFGVREGEQICSYVIDAEDLTCRRTDYVDVEKQRLEKPIRDRDRATVREILCYLEAFEGAKQSDVVDAVHAKRMEQERSADEVTIYGAVKIRKVLTSDMYLNVRGYWRESRGSIKSNTIYYSTYPLSEA